MQLSCNTLLHAGKIITQNESREVLDNASLAINDGFIVAIGPTESMRAQWRPQKELDFSDSLVMPGLINAHTHAAMTFLRGLADDLPLMTWLEQHIFPVEASLTSEITRLGSLLGYAEMLACGVTACVDMYIFEEAVFEAAAQAGIRCMGGEAVFTFPSAACADWREALRRTRLLAEKYSGNDRLSVAVNPHSVYAATPEILDACRSLAQEINAPLHIHLAETREETRRCQDAFGMRPVAFCDSRGLFDCRVIAAHLVDIDSAEIDFLASRSVVAAHNPSSNMKLASGISPVPEMLNAGMTVALGTDGAASNNNLNMFAEMSRAALLHKVSSQNPTTLSAGQTLDMATLGGAAAFGNDKLGALAPGMAADCVALDLSRPNMRPLHNAISQTVYAASGHECRMTMVGGEILYLDGNFTRFDYNDLCRETEKLRDFARRKSSKS